MPCWGAVVAQAQGNSAAAGAAGAATGELIAAQLFPDKRRDQLSEEDKQTISALATLASGLAGAAAGGDLASAVAAGQAGRNAAENNALSDIIENKAEGITQEEKYQRAQDELIRAVAAFKAQKCAGLSSDACAVKMKAHQKELLTEAALFGVDFVPGVGDFKSFAEAKTATDYLAAVIGVVPVVGDVAGKTIKVGAKATGQIVPDVVSPTYRELQGLNKGFQAHHTLPQYLGKMLGYTKMTCWITLQR